MLKRLSILCRLLLLYGLVPGMSLLLSGSSTNAPNAASISAGTVEDSEPNDAYSILEFRIAPQKPGYRRRPSPLTRQEIEQCRKDLTENGPSASIKRDDEFVWMEIMEGVKLPEYLTTEEYQGTDYLLLHNWPPFVMTSETGWGLQSVTRGKADNIGRPYVRFQFDWDGADRFYYLTSANVDQALAIIIEGKVVSAASIESAIRSQAVITGDFTTEQLNGMIKTLQKIARPVSTTVVPVVRRELSTYLIPVLILVLAVTIVGFLVYR